MGKEPLALTIRVFVGCAANHEDAESQLVLEHSIRSRTHEDVDITWMKLSKDPLSPFYSDPEAGRGWNTESWATPFSGFRWCVPHLCNYEGRAIYLDSDIIFLKDINKLWSMGLLSGTHVGAKGGNRFCVSLWDCANTPRRDWKKMRENKEQHRIVGSYYRSHAEQVTRFLDIDWNCLDGRGYDNIQDPKIGAIHYTSMPHQPQLKYAIPRLEHEGREHWFDGVTHRHWNEDIIELFERQMYNAIADGSHVAAYCEDPEFGPYKKTSHRGRFT